MQTTKQRIAYLDWLRTFAILGVLLYHAARPFIVDDPWHVNDPVKSDILSEFNYFLSRFRMPLLFFISGSVTWLMMKNRTAIQFIGLRLRRLFVPLVVGILIIVPPQIYMERLTQGFTGSFWDFYPSTFTTGPYPKGNFSWHHLWFIAYLFVYDLLLAPFFGWCRTEKAAGFIKKLGFFARGKNVYLLVIPSVIIFSLMVQDFPATNDLIHDPLYFIYWLLFLLVGFLCILQPEIMESLERNRRFSLQVAFVLLLLINGLRWNDFEWFAGGTNTHDLPTYLYLARQPLHTWLWVFALVGYGKHYLNQPHPLLNKISASLYPFYILHQTIIVVIAYYVVQTPDTAGMKWGFLVMSCLFVSVMLLELFIKPFRITRFLFGMKADKAKPALVYPAPQTIVT